MEWHIMLGSITHKVSDILRRRLALLKILNGNVHKIHTLSIMDHQHWDIDIDIKSLEED